MAFDLINLIVLIISILLIVMIADIEKKSRRNHIDISFLIGGLLCISLGNFLMIFGIYQRIIGSLLQSFGMILIFFHYEAIHSGRPNPVLMTLILALFAICFVLEVLRMNFYYSIGVEIFTNETIPAWDNSVLHNIIKLTSYLYDIISTITLLNALIIMNKVHKRVQIKATLQELIAIWFLMGYRVIYFVWYFVVPDIKWIVETIALLLSVIGLLILISNYISYPDYLYLLPFPIHSLMLYNQSGISYYSYQNTAQTSMDEDKFQLVTGAFTAISSLIQETLGKNAHLERIQAENFQIFFERLPKDSGTFVVIANGETAFFKKALKRFINALSPEVLININNQIQDLDPIHSEIDSNAKQFFPYAFSVELNQK